MLIARLTHIKSKILFINNKTKTLIYKEKNGSKWRHILNFIKQLLILNIQQYFQNFQNKMNTNKISESINRMKTKKNPVHTYNPIELHAYRINKRETHKRGNLISYP